jgi:putative ubiquitin-RnfH superfamily antitoxin RatB of RatAB toxin-antitoxin module
MADVVASLHVQVCFAKPDMQILRDLIVPEGTTLHGAIVRSGLLDEVTEIDLATCRVGIYGKLKPLDTVLRDRDRIEVYRPLMADPKESRRKRAVNKDHKNPGKPVRP